MVKAIQKELWITRNGVRFKFKSAFTLPSMKGKSIQWRGSKRVYSCYFLGPGR